MNKTTKLFLFLAFTLLAAHAQHPWELKKNANGIKIYTREVPHSSFKEYKAMTTVEQGINEVLQQLLNAPKYKAPLVSGKSYYVSARGADQHIFYAHKDLPWPLRDRDVVTLLSVEHISEYKIKLRLECLPDGIPTHNEALRIKELMGFWLLEEQQGLTTITQQLHLNPEGTLPAAIVNSLLIKGPYKTFSALQQTGL